MHKVSEPQLTLADLQVGQEATIIGFAEGNAAYRKKLLAMGLTRKVPVKVIKSAPLGDPMELEVRGYRLSLRRMESQTVRVRRST